MRARHALPVLTAVAALVLTGCADNTKAVAGGSSTTVLKKDAAAAASFFRTVVDEPPATALVLSAQPGSTRAATAVSTGSACLARIGHPLQLFFGRASVVPSSHWFVADGRMRV